MLFRSWSKQFQKGEVPEDVEGVSVTADAVSVKADGIRLGTYPAGQVFVVSGDRNLQNGETVPVKVVTVSPDAEEFGSAFPLQGGRPLQDVVEGPYFIRVDKLLREAGLVSSATEASRKLKEKAVRINQELVPGLVFIAYLPVEISVRVGKRLKRVALLK